MNKTVRRLPLLLAFGLLCVSCRKYPEMTLEEIEAYRAGSQNGLVERTVSRPFRNDKWKAGTVGGVWNTSISSDPKSFNFLIAERDGETAAILSHLNEYLVDYNVVTKEWEPRLADFEITVNEDDDTLDVLYTLRDDIYWSFRDGSRPKVKVTSDDVVFWYNEICGDESMGSSGFNSQFMEMKDGSSRHIDIEKIDGRRFVFHFPRIIAEPLLSSNMNFGPAFIYSEAKKRGGTAAVMNLHGVQVNPAEIPSCGRYFISEYTPGQRLVFERNPDYWEKDENGQSIVYPEKKIALIVGDNNTSFLLFKQGNVETYSPLPEQLEEIVRNADNAFDRFGNARAECGQDGYTVFNSAGNLSASFWTFNQNPKNKDKPFYSWFCRTEFRQAMSCLLNRERIIAQTFRGLAEPKYSFFPEPNAYYNEEIILPYRFSHAHAQKLLSQAGFAKKDDGFLYDERGNKVEFDLAVVSSQAVFSDIAQIIADECKKEGITVNVRQTDFQKMVDQLFSVYDWESLIIGLSGSSIFPTQGSNVWVSSGNLHMWYPLQKEPATEWEARVDYLYNEASCIIEYEKAKPYWDEYQRILLEQCPVIYLVRGRSFFAIQNRWDLSNVYFDNIVGSETSHVFIR